MLPSNVRFDCAVAWLIDDPLAVSIRLVPAFPIALKPVPDVPEDPADPDSPERPEGPVGPGAPPM